MAILPETQQRTETVGAFRALRHRDFRLYLFGLMVSLAGSYMQTVAEGWLVYQITNSAFSLGLVGFVAMVPLAPWSMVVGALADRMPRKTLLAISQVGQIFPPLVLALLTWLGVVQVWHVILVDLVLGAMSTIDQTVRQALVVDVVGPEDVDNALALSASGFNIARVVGPAVAGVLIGAMGVAGAFALNGVSFIAVLVALMLMRVTPRPRARQASLGVHMMEGVKYLLREWSILRMMILMLVVSFFILPYQTLLPVFARDIFSSGAEGLGLLTAAAGLGGIVGAFGVANWSRVSQNRRWFGVVVLTVVSGILTTAFAFSGNFWLACALLAGASAGIVALRTVGFTMIQIETRDELRGRITGILLLLSGATPRVGGLVAGYIASRAGAPISLALGAGVCFAFAVGAIGVGFTRRRAAVG